jgi:hypothetical protein
MQQQADIAITPEDIAELLRQNPMAAEQAKSIALQRMNLELQAQLEQMKNGHQEEVEKIED